MIDTCIEDRYGERVVIIKSSMKGTISSCAYFPPASPGSISIKRYRVVVDFDPNIFLGNGKNFDWFNEEEIETDVEHYRNEKLKKLGI